MKAFILLKISILLLFVFGINERILGQEPDMCSQELIPCSFLPQTPESPEGAIAFYEDMTWEDDQKPIYVKLYVHVIRRTDHSGGLTEQQVKNSLNILREDFSPGNIYFILDCNIIPIYDTDEFNKPRGDETQGIFDNDPHIDGIDIYFYPELSTEIKQGFNTSNVL